MLLVSQQQSGKTFVKMHTQIEYAVPALMPWLGSARPEQRPEQIRMDA